MRFFVGSGRGLNLLPMAATCMVCAGARGQANSWTSPASGNWENPSWSLGILPGPNQSIYITNAGWKAVEIGPSTVETQPQSLSVNSITIASPADTFNTLLLNYTGFDTPVIARSIVIGSNAAITMLSSVLEITGPSGVGMSIAGQFNQGVNSIVTGGQLDAGYSGPGLYRFTSGILDMNNIFLGAAFNGTLIQSGGTNAGGTVHLEGGQYILQGGEYNAATYFINGGLFRQQGGRLNSGIEAHSGFYILEDGINFGGVVLPQSDGFSSSGAASALQTGGALLGPVFIGGFAGSGSYVLSNGVVNASTFSEGILSSFSQWGGMVTTTGAVSLVGGFVDRGNISLATYTLEGGQVISGGIEMNLASFTEDGGTNLVAGDVIMSSAMHNQFNLNGGILSANNLSVASSFAGGFIQSGGVNSISNRLSIDGSASPPVFPFWRGYVMSNGVLTVSDIVLNPGAALTQTGGTISQSGVLTLIAGSLTAGPGSQQFGALQLSAAGVATNSTLTLPANAACALHFGNSSGLAWSNAAVFMIANWLGSPSGSGSQQIIFGSDASALTSSQLGQILFANPAGLAPGNYTSKILSDGEVVPDKPVTPMIGSAVLKLSAESGGLVQLALQGLVGGNYQIQVSTDLVHWTPLTNQEATNGTLSIQDIATTNFPQQFFRALLLP